MKYGRFFFFLLPLLVLLAGEIIRPAFQLSYHHQDVEKEIRKFKTKDIILTDPVSKKEQRRRQITLDRAGEIAHQGKKVKPEKKTKEIEAILGGKEAIATLWVGTIFMVFLFASLGGTGYAAKLIWDTAGGRNEGAGILSAAAIFSMLIAHRLVDGVHMYVRLGKELFLKTVGEYAGMREIGFDFLGTNYFKWPVYPAGNIPLLDMIIDIQNTLAVFGGVFIAVAACALMPHFQNLDQTELSARIQRIKYLLLWGAAVFVSGMFAMKAWREWPLSFLNETSVYSAIYANVADASFQFQAVQFFLVLVAIFGPVSQALHNAGYKLANVKAPGKTPEIIEKWMKDMRLKLSLQEYSTRLITIMTPLLAGAAPKLLEAMSLLTK